MPSFHQNIAFIIVNFDTASASGSVGCPGLKVGDIMLSLTALDVATVGNQSFLSSGQFEAVISNDDEILQNGTGFASGTTLIATFLRPSF